LWRFDVHLESVQDGESTRSYHCDDKTVWAELGDTPKAVAAS